MTGVPFFQVDAFAERPLAGNPAAVLPLDRWLRDEAMQAIGSTTEPARALPMQRLLGQLVAIRERCLNQGRDIPWRTAE